VIDVDRQIALSNGYTPLHMAVYRCDAAAVENILNSGAANLEAKAIWDETPLHLAAKKKECAGIMRLLVKHGARVEAEGIHKTRPVHSAASEGEVENVRALAESGADINVRGGAVVCGNCYRSPLEAAINGGKTASALYLISRGAKIETLAHYSIRPEYHLAWVMPRTTRASRIVHGDPSRFGHDEFSPLQASVVLGQDEVAAALIAKGARVNSNPGRGASPLALASWYGRRAMAELLLKKGARLDLKDGCSRTALHYALENRKGDIAVKLIDAGADVNAGDLYGATPLHVAARNGDREMVLLLISKGARRDARDSCGKTPADFTEDRALRRLLE
jgi:cytohesin